MKAKVVCLLAFAGLALAACSAGEGIVAVEDAWIPAAPPGAGVMAGYLTLRNGGAGALRCERASGADFGAIEIHRTLIEDGQSRMLRDQVIEAAPGATASLAPGGMHLMLFRPQRELKPGDTTALTLHCGETNVAASFRIQEPR